MTNGWIEVEETKPAFWNPTVPGQMIEGEVVGMNDGDHGPYWRVRDKEGDEFFTSSHKQLQNTMRNVAIGTRVQIHFVGSEETRPGQSAMKMYKVYREQVNS